MKKNISSLLVIGIQLLLVGLFFVSFITNEAVLENHNVVIDNENLNKIATSVSLLFKEEKVVLVDDMLDEFILNDLPALDKVEEIVQEETKEEKDEIKSTPLFTLDASKYTNNVAMGFKVTEGNKKYNLTDEEFDVVVAVVAGEFDKNLDDALGVVSVILNRCDSNMWGKWFGNSPYKQVTASGQFEVYFANMYQKYMPGGSRYGDSKYEIAKQAVLDGLNGIRNNDYLGFRAWWLSGYSNKYIVNGGNRYGYN